MSQLCDTLRVGLIGRNIAYSKSPAVFNKWFDECHIQAQFDLLDWQELTLTKVLALQDLYKGVCVTIPYKQELFHLLKVYDKAVITETALATGAINALVFREGKVYAYNTDAMALHSFLNSSKSLLNFKTHENEQPLTALIFGAGGAAAASVFALEQWAKDAQIPIQILSMNRSLKPFNENLTMELNQENLNDIHPQIVVNATPLGAGRQVEDDTQFEDLLNSLNEDEVKVLVDWVYGDKETCLCNWARRNTIPVVIKGEALLYEQARYNFKLWFDRFPDACAR